ncbi:hypothetical protein [Streptomyces sp. NRRL S-244]|uniref:hypothetical protein n=1 Tax=Streptomyces sp. NRRL S-244 TaxID=1463897 RepID=UPI0004BFCD92|nr:hypothetical protein [Streptomyces sp. NRRL S-244]
MLPPTDDRLLPDQRLTGISYTALACLGPGCSTEWLAAPQSAPPSDKLANGKVQWLPGVCQLTSALELLVPLGGG